MAKRRFKKPFNRRRKNPHRINNEIRVPKVRLVGDDVGQKLCTVEEALEHAQSKGLDLVEISPKADPPVVKAIDYNKFLYEQKKKQKEMKAKSSKMIQKELRFGPNTDDHDFQFKLNHAKKFLKEGAKLKAYVFFKGRSILFKEQGEVLLLKLATELEEYGVVESMPKLEGKRMIMMISPKKKKN